MAAAIAAEALLVESKRIKISQKRQITIPRKYFIDLGLTDEAECIYMDGALVIVPPKTHGGEFAEEILVELVNEGYQGEQLVKEFSRRNRQVRPAVEKMLQEADALALRASLKYVDRTSAIFGRKE